MRRWAAESAGTTVLVVVLCCALTSGNALAPAAIGVVTATMLALGPRAGGAYNPAVAAARWVRGEVTGRTLAGVLAAHLTGALVAAVTARALLGDAPGAAVDGPGGPVPGVLASRSLHVDAPALIAMEAVGTFCVVYVVCWCSGVASHRQSAVVVGLTVMAMTVTAGQFGAGFFNPAAGIAAAAVGLTSPTVVTAGMAAQLFGAVAAALALGVARRRAVARGPDVATRSERMVGAVGRAPRAVLPVIPRPRSAGEPATDGHGVTGHPTSRQAAVSHRPMATAGLPGT